MLPWLNEAIVVPVGDVQYGSEACDFDRFKRHMAWAAEQPNAYFIGMGDMVDFGSPSNRGNLKALIEKQELYDTAEDILDGAAETALEALYEVLEPTRGRWLGMVEGHHFWTFGDGTTSDTRLCQFLKAPFLGHCGMVRVNFHPGDRKKGATHQKQVGFTIWAAHGRGGGVLHSAPLNKLEHVLKAFDADVYLLGHHHKKSSAKMSRIVPLFARRGGRSHRLHHKELIITGTGGFLKGYMLGSKRGGRAQGTYVEKGLMNPVALGGVVIRARPVYHENVPRVDLELSI